MKNLAEILEPYTQDRQLGLVVQQTLEFLEWSEIKSQRTANDPQPAKDVARFQEIRRQTNYYQESNVVGVMETIQKLSNQEAFVRITTAETDRGVIALWFDELDHSLSGLILAKYTT